MQNAYCDRIIKESVNQVGLGAVRAAVKQVFPDVSPDEDVCPEGFEAVHGLVLDTPYGFGAFQLFATPDKERYATLQDTGIGVLDV